MIPRCVPSPTLSNSVQLCQFGAGVPPRTRGSSLDEVVILVVELGSPAHAGIVPTRPRARSNSDGFPRARGDRPAAAAAIASARAVPPRTRGSSHLLSRLKTRRAGSPAHAGIVPSTADRRDRCLWFPRARGDRPRRHQAGSCAGAVPPRTRGSSRHKRRPHQRGVGSPAHAGIVPSLGLEEYRWTRFPRARGDRPSSWKWSRTLLKVPPRTRGSSPAVKGVVVGVQGSPAHAGIVPRRVPSGPEGGRFPRARGDRPTPAATRRDRPRVPPRTRGSSLGRPVTRDLGTGSPAHAGIVPARTTRGSRRWRFPRARGDRPSTSKVGALPGAVPPRTRGSSPHPAPRRWRGHGSPAHAGIVPCLTSRRVKRVGFPRARGDRPVVYDEESTRSTVPPRTRGSSPNRTGRRNTS